MLIDTASLTDDDYEAARLAIEDELVRLRDSRISVFRNNGLCIKERDSSPSDMIRMSTPDAVRMAIKVFEDRRKRP